MINILVNFIISGIFCFSKTKTKTKPQYMSEQEGLLCLAMQLTWCSDTALFLQTRKEDIQQLGDSLSSEYIAG